MLDLKQFLKAFHRSKSIEDLIPLSHFATDRILLTDTGSAVAMIGLDPIDDECLSSEEKAFYVNRLIAAGQLLDSAYQHYQYVFKSRQFSIPSDPSGIAPAQNIKDLRVQHLYKQGNVAIEPVIGNIDIYHAIEHILPYTAKQQARFDTYRRDAAYKKLVSDLETTLTAYTESLSDILHARVVDKHELLTVCQRLLDPASRWSDGPDLNKYSVSRQLQASSVYWDRDVNMLRIGRRYARVFTLNDLPDETMPNTFGALLSVPADMVIISTWRAKERLNERARLTTLRNLTFNLQRVQVIGASRAIRRDPSAAQDLKDAGVHDDLTEINESMRSLRNKKYTGKYALTVVLHAETPLDLEIPAAQIGKVFRLPSASLHEEVGQPLIGTALPVYFSAIPGNRDLNVRALNLRNDHYADLSYVWGSDVGCKRSSVLEGEYCNVYQTRMGPLYYADTHSNLVAAELTIGMTRSGKTAYTADRIAALQSRNPITRIYDVGGSYEPLAAYFKGSVLNCTLDGWRAEVNPFHGNLKSRNFREFLHQFIRSLIESDSYRMTQPDHQQLHEKLGGIYALESEHLRRLKTLRSALHGPMKDALTKWVEGGQYGSLFDHPRDTLVLSDFQVYEFERAEEGMPSPYLEAMQLLLIYRDTKTALDRSVLGRPKYVVFDECTSHWKHPEVANHVQRILQTWQKKLGMVSLVTQSPESMGHLEPFILQNCSSFAFFPNPKITDECLIKKFGFDQSRIDIYRTLRPREFLYHTLRGTGDLWKVLKLTVDLERYWIYTTSPKDALIRDRMIAQCGGNIPQAIRALSAEGAA